MQKKKRKKRVELHLFPYNYIKKIILLIHTMFKKFVKVEIVIA